MKKAAFLVLTILIVFSLNSMSLSATEYSFDEIERIITERRVEADGYLDYVYRLWNTVDESKTSIGFGVGDYYSIAYNMETNTTVEWSDLVKRASSIFDENMLYRALYNDLVREKDGFVYKVTGDLPYIESYSRGQKGDYVKTFKVDERVYGRYISYSKENGDVLYRVEFWKYDSEKDEFLLIDTNDISMFLRYATFENRSEYLTYDYYPDYDGGEIEVDAFKDYCTAVYCISKAMAAHKDILGYDLSDENVTLSVISCKNDIIRVSLCLPLYSANGTVDGLKETLVVIDKDLLEEGVVYYDYELGYHPYSGIIYEEFSGEEYVYIPSTDDSCGLYLNISICATTIICLVFLFYIRKERI